MTRTATRIAAKHSQAPKPQRRKKPPDATGEQPVVVVDPVLEQRVREAAYFIYERSGRVDGRELENWLEAEAWLLREEAQAAPGRSQAD
jgi:Protein of unknown function (DUF2934)